MKTIEKIYIEPTNHCNLICKTCLRNTWDNTSAMISYETFTTLIQDLRSLSSLKTIMFSGFGEPLCHPDIFKMIALAKTLNIQVEMISNGMLLNEDKCNQLIDAGLDQIWISIDGASAEKFEQIRTGASQDLLLTNIMTLNTRRIIRRSSLKLGISFVAMKDNIHELGDLIDLAKELNANDLKVTNVLPYTKELAKQALYDHTLSFDGTEFSHKLRVDMPPMDLNNEFGLIIDKVHKRSDIDLSIMGSRLNRQYDYCKFIEENCIIIGADGRVAPCLALLYDNKTWLNGYEREIKEKSYGNIHDHSLSHIWNLEDYSSFRDLVQSFDFAHCIACGGCNNLESNEEDCFGNTFPVCGGCLWAQGIVQCP